MTGYDEGRIGSDDQGLNHSQMSDLVSHAVCCLTEISILVAESRPMNTETISGPAVRACCAASGCDGDLGCVALMGGEGVPYASAEMLMTEQVVAAVYMRIYRFTWRMRPVVRLSA